MTALERVLEAAEPALRANAVSPAPAGRFGAPLDEQRAFVLEAVHEGWLMHYREPHGFRGMDDDLRLLGGDSLYALGLARLAELGDLGAVAELADLISLCAWAEAEGHEELGERLWQASADALSGTGPGARAIRDGSGL